MKVCQILIIFRLIQGVIVSGHQLHAHFLEQQQNSKRSKMCVFSWSIHGRSQSPLGLINLLFFAFYCVIQNFYACFKRKYVFWFIIVIARSKKQRLFQSLQKNICSFNPFIPWIWGTFEIDTWVSYSVTDHLLTQL